MVDVAGTVTDPVYFKHGYPWVDVVAWGADPTGAAESSAAIQAAIDYAGTSLIGGTVYFPPGFYKCTTGIVINPSTNEITLRGASRFASVLFCGDADITILTSNGLGCLVETLSFQGKGSNNNNARPGTFGATKPVIACGPLSMRDVVITGGYNCISIAGSDDGLFENVYCTNAYGNAIVASGSAGASGAGNWFLRCKFDQNYPVKTPNPDPSVAFAPWKAGNSYARGDTAVLSGLYLVQAMVAGASGETEPPVANYNVDIVDGGVIWHLCYPLDYCAFLLETNSNSNNWAMCDFTGSFPWSITMRHTLGAGSPPALAQFSGCTMGGAYNGALNLVDGNTCVITNCVMGGNVSRGTSSVVTTQPGWQGGLTITDSLIFGANYGVTINGGPGTVISTNIIAGCDNYAVAVAPGTTDFTITSNNMGPVATLGANGNAVEIQNGPSDYYIVSNNIVHGLIISDQGMGTHKSVTGNV